MKKIILGAMVALTLTTTVSARETKLFPIVTDSNYCLTPSVAVVAGVDSYDGTSGTAYGVELSMACPALQLSSVFIKQQVSLVTRDSDGFKATSLEFNPHAIFDISKELTVGVGPGFGVIFADVDGASSDTVFGVNLGASVTYDITPSAFVGLEARYQWTTDAEFVSGTKVNLDNSRTLLKVGMHF